MEDLMDIPQQTPNTEKIIDKIQNIVLKESQVTKLTVDDDKIILLSETTPKTISDEEADTLTEDENDNETNLTRAETFYKDAQNYWKSVPATIDGMLGGFSNISFTDIRGSQDFLKEIYKMKPSPSRNLALDCGAGIGRVTKHLLLPIFDKVDVVEQDERFANSVKEYVGNSPKLGTVYNQGLQEFQPIQRNYDVIWIQWVLAHLTNDDFVQFFQRCVAGLNKNGIVVIKDNVTSSDNIDIDQVDSSVTRPLAMLKGLITGSGLRIIKMVRQNNFPSGIFPVYMFALKPMKKNV